MLIVIRMRNNSIYKETVHLDLVDPPLVHLRPNPREAVEHLLPSSGVYPLQSRLVEAMLPLVSFTLLRTIEEVRNIASHFIQKIVSGPSTSS